MQQAFIFFLSDAISSIDGMMFRILIVANDHEIAWKYSYHSWTREISLKRFSVLLGRTWIFTGWA